MHEDVASLRAIVHGLRMQVCPSGYLELYQCLNYCPPIGPYNHDGQKLASVWAFWERCECGTRRFATSNDPCICA
jgi:hypothetical protein